MVRSDASDDRRGRVRAETDPPRPSSHFSENIYQSNRDGWFDNHAMTSRRSSSPSTRAVLSPLKKTLEYSFGGGSFLQKNKRAHGGSCREALSSSGSWPKIKPTRKPPVPTCYESGGSATSHSEEAPSGTPHAPRRRHHHHHHRKGVWGKEARPLPTTRQQRLVTSMFVLVVVLGSIQIIALFVHPQTGRSFALGGLTGVAVSGGAGGAGIDEGSSLGNNNRNNGVRRRASGGGFRDKFFGTASDGIDGDIGAAATQASARGLRGGVFNNNNNNEVVQQNQHSLSLSNPRAFEMVAADMGHLKDTVSHHQSSSGNKSTCSVCWLGCSFENEI